MAIVSSETRGKSSCLTGQSMVHVCGLTGQGTMDTAPLPWPVLGEVHPGSWAY